MTIVPIQKGDSLFAIGKRYGVTVDQLVRANGVDPDQYLVPGDCLIIPAAEEPAGELEVNGYAYPFIDRAVLEKTLPYLTYLSLFSYGFHRDGTPVPIRNDEELISIAWSQNVAPVLVLTTVDESGGFSSERAAALLRDPAAQQRLASGLNDLMNEKGYYAVDVDMEYIPAYLAEAYRAFLELLRGAVEPHPVFVSLAPKTARNQRGLLYEAHDYAALGNAADRALIMSYEWGYTFSRPMAVAPLPAVERVMNFAVGEIPRDKILMGMPNYGYDWLLPYEQGRPARSIGNYEAIALARKYGAAVQYDEEAQAPTFHYYDQRGRQHEVWYEDDRSYHAKLELVRGLGLRGVSIWNIMRFFQPLYTLLNGYFNIKKISRKE